MTEFISRKYGNESYEIIIKTDSYDHCMATEDFARRLIDHSKPQTNERCKPCPFCGNTNITCATHKPVGGAEFYEVICVECGARVRRSSKRKAVEAWNMRVGNIYE